VWSYEVVVDSESINYCLCGWVMKMSFEKKIGGTAALKALQTYARRLEEKYGKKAFQHFSDANMQILFEK